MSANHCRPTSIPAMFLVSSMAVANAVRWFCSNERVSIRAAIGQNETGQHHVRKPAQNVGRITTQPTANRRVANGVNGFNRAVPRCSARLAFCCLAPRRSTTASNQPKTTTLSVSVGVRLAIIFATANAAVKHAAQFSKIHSML